MILVTGATGFVGHPLCARLVQCRQIARAAVRSAQPKLLATEQVVVGDVSGETEWYTALQGIRCVVHLAARVQAMNETSADLLAAYRAVNTAGTLNLARQAAAEGVRRFVFVSTLKVLGESTALGHAFQCEDAMAPQDPYGISKAEAESGLREIASHTGMDVVIIRPPLVYGPGVKGNFASMVRWIRKGVPLPLGAVHNQRSLVALDNLIDFIALCADRERSPSAANETFLISDGEDVSTTELLRKVARAYGVPSRLLPIPEAWIQLAANLLGKGAVADRLLGSLVVDSAKACALLGWSPVVSMDQQLKKMAQHDALL